MLDTRPESAFGDLLLLAASTSPGSVALIADGKGITYEELATRVTERAQQLAGPRSVVVVESSRTLEFVVEYLGLLRAAHVPLLTETRHAEALRRHWAGVATEGIHPDLALLMSTSGSLGSPKLVRLSHRNLASNARSIAEALRITAADRAITTLPLQYSYGLSVLHSHLMAGASVVLSENSVVDPCFRTTLLEHDVTHLAGVPHTFELMERSSFEPADFPSLRIITVSGGRMDPDRVRHWATRPGTAEFAVMYGQTEATARMAVLDPVDVREHPAAFGRVIPGGELFLRAHPDAPGDDQGELVYRGPNVMMGYAIEQADLARGPEVTELATGDMARRVPGTDIFEIVGRSARFIKPFGVRIDLDHLNGSLSTREADVVAGGTDEGLVVAVAARSDDGEPTGVPSAVLLDGVRDAARSTTGLPASYITVVGLEQIPHTASGKVDYAAILELAAARRVDSPSPSGDGPTAVGSGTDDVLRAVLDVVRSALGRQAVTADDTFVGLGGDSLSYVECSIRLESLVGSLPHDWPTTPFGVLVSNGRVQRTPRIDTTVVLRAIGICTIVSSHMFLKRIPGGAHTLLTIAGYNFARFALSATSVSDRLRSGVRTIARVAVPAILWIGINILVSGRYTLGNFLLVNNYVAGSTAPAMLFHYWFTEVFVQLSVVMLLVMCIPSVSTLERRRPMMFVGALLVPLLLVRFEIIPWGDETHYQFRTHVVAWFFAIGWLIHRSTTITRRVVVSLLILATVPGFFVIEGRTVYVIVALLAVTWIPRIPMPYGAQRVIGAIASASMWIYLVHWQVFPPLARLLERRLAYVATLASGVAVWWLATQTQRRMVMAVRARSLRGAFPTMRQRAVGVATRVADQASPTK